jgi:hypothetical protein
MRDCPSKSKTGAWATYTEAHRALLKMRRKGNKSGDPMPNHVYRCPCTMFHLTSDKTAKAKTVKLRRQRERLRYS